MATKEMVPCSKTTRRTRVLLGWQLWLSDELMVLTSNISLTLSNVVLSRNGYYCKVRLFWTSTWDCAWFCKISAASLSDYVLHASHGCAKDLQKLCLLVKMVTSGCRNFDEPNVFVVQPVFLDDHLATTLQPVGWLSFILIDSGMIIDRICGKWCEL